MNLFTYVFLIAAGIAVAFQAGVNGTLGRKTGTIEAAFISFAIGTIALLVVMLLSRKGDVSLVKEAPAWQLTGGLLGAFYISVVIILVPKIGIGSVLMILIIAQLSTSALIDHFGVFTGVSIPLSWKKLTALGMMGAALVLFYKK